MLQLKEQVPIDLGFPFVELLPELPSAPTSVTRSGSRSKSKGMSIRTKNVVVETEVYRWTRPKMQSKQQNCCRPSSHNNNLPFVCVQNLHLKIFRERTSFTNYKTTRSKTTTTEALHCHNSPLFSLSTLSPLFKHQQRHQSQHQHLCFRSTEKYFFHVLILHLSMLNN